MWHVSLLTTLPFTSALEGYCLSLGIESSFLGLRLALSVSLPKMRTSTTLALWKMIWQTVELHVDRLHNSLVHLVIFCTVLSEQRSAATGLQWFDGLQCFDAVGWVSGRASCP